jgi:quercetin dioxygenase-like cupin family protein
MKLPAPSLVSVAKYNRGPSAEDRGTKLHGSGAAEVVTGNGASGCGWALPQLNSVRCSKRKANLAQSELVLIGRDEVICWRLSQVSSLDWQFWVMRQPMALLEEIVVPEVLPTDDRLWVPQTEHTSFRPLCLNVTENYWVNVLRVRKHGMISRHRHPKAVHGYVLKGNWYYLESTWKAAPGSYVYEPPGVVHTLMVPDHVEEMITLFQVNGELLYLDEQGNQTSYDDVHTKIEFCRQHFQAVGLGADYVDRFIR